MPITTATAVTLYTSISCSAQTIINNHLIEDVQMAIVMRTNNYFTTDIDLQDYVTFDPLLKTITCNNVDFIIEGFIKGLDIYIYGSYLNDGYYTLKDVTKNVLKLENCTLYNEPSDRPILVSLVKWPPELSKIACKMIEYDYDIRPKRVGIRSHSLGPFSETYTETGLDDYGYPIEITGALEKYTIARFY